MRLFTTLWVMPNLAPTSRSESPSKKIAKAGPCVLVGRCADYALEDNPELLSVFIHANMDARIRRIARDFDLTDAKAKDMIRKTDKQRSSYYNYYTNKRWGDANSYQFCLDSSKLGIEGTVDAILKLIEIKDDQKINKKIY